MIKLRNLVESYGNEDQYYDLGKDFSNFRRMIDGADQQIRQQYENIISSKLVGKRVRARASRGYKQYVKDYEFDIARISLDDYYDNYMVVAYDNTTPKPKEYFLKPRFKIQILGTASGQSLQQPQDKKQSQTVPQNTTSVQPGITQSDRPLEEEKNETNNDNNGLYDAYSIDEIEKDIKPWLSLILKKPETSFRDFIKGLGWKKKIENGTSVALYDLKIPSNKIKKGINANFLKELVSKTNKNQLKNKYELTKIDPDDSKGIWNIRIKKTITNNSNYE